MAGIPWALNAGEFLKAITLLQPWATLVVTGEKRNETRSWQTHHRGLLLIHSSKRFTEAARALCGTEPFRSALRKHGYKRPSALPLGQILGVVQLEDCQPTLEGGGCENDHELAFGDYRPGRWVWILSNPRPLAQPLAYRGMQSLFEVPDAWILPYLPENAPGQD